MDLKRALPEFQPAGNFKIRQTDPLGTFGAIIKIYKVIGTPPGIGFKHFYCRSKIFTFFAKIIM
jgi:hypothetical protein